MDAVLTRKSIRKYTDQEVTKDHVRQLLQAGMSAPSAGNQRPWHFVVVEDRNLLEAIPGIHPYAQMVKDARIAIVVCADPTLEKYPGFWVQDCSAATENILIAAQSLGLGAVWCGLYPVGDRVGAVRQLLKIPEHITPFSLVPIGYPAERRDVTDRYDETRVHYNSWKS